MEEDIIDSEQEAITTPYCVQWWEKRRALYNIILAGTSGVVMVFESYFFSITFLPILIIFFIIANLFYCLGWGVELLFNHYFKKEFPFNKMGLFILGCLFSTFIILGGGFA